MVKYPLYNDSPKVQETVYSGQPLSQNIDTWISWYIIKFHLAFKNTCSYKYIVIRKIGLWNLVPGKSDVISKIMTWNQISFVPYYKTCKFIINIIVVSIRIFTWWGLHLRWSIRITAPIFESTRFSHMAYIWHINTIFYVISANNNIIIWVNTATLLAQSGWNPLISSKMLNMSLYLWGFPIGKFKRQSSIIWIKMIYKPVTLGNTMTLMESNLPSQLWLVTSV